MYRVAPYGERRADIRQAISTANIIAANAAEKVDDAAFTDAVERMSNYLRDAESYEDAEDLAALKRMKEG